MARELPQLSTEGYELNESTRAKHVSIKIFPDGRVVVTKPARVSVRALEGWLAGKQAWIEETRSKFIRAHERSEQKHGKAIPLPKLRRGTKAYKEAQKQARSIATERIKHFGALGNFTYGSISIRNQKTRWGSCSAAGNLSFNYRIVHLPPELVDYLVVHELSHTKHHNHSARFWGEVAKHVPNYKEKRLALHRYKF